MLLVMVLRFVACCGINSGDRIVDCCNYFLSSSMTVVVLIIVVVGEHTVVVSADCCV